MVADDTKTMIVVFAYNQIKEIVDNMLGQFAFGVPTDLLMAILGYYKRHTWWGKGLLYGALANLGQSGALGIIKLTGSNTGKTQTSASMAARQYLA